MLVTIIWASLVYGIINSALGDKKAPVPISMISRDARIIGCNGEELTGEQFLEEPPCPEDL